MSEHSDDEEKIIAEQNNSPLHSSGPASENEEPEDDIVQQALRRTTQRAPLRRGEIDLGDDEEEEIVDEMIRLMDTAADADKESLTKGTMAIAKLLAKDKVEKFLNCGKYHETFLNMNGCILLNKWIAKHADGTFPCNPVKEMILRSIKDLPITIENLQESGLGKSVAAIGSSPSTSMDIKKLANELKEKWMRMIYGRTTDYS